MYMYIYIYIYILYIYIYIYINDSIYLIVLCYSVMYFSLNHRIEECLQKQLHLIER